MKRRNFLASIAAIFAAPFVVKKPKTVGIYVNGSKIGECNDLKAAWPTTRIQQLDECDNLIDVTSKDTPGFKEGFKEVILRPYRMKSNIKVTDELLSFNGIIKERHII